MGLAKLTLDPSEVRGGFDDSLRPGAHMTLARVLELRPGDRLVFVVERSLLRLVPVFAAVADELQLDALWLVGEGEDFDSTRVRRELRAELRTATGSVLLCPMAGLTAHFRRWFTRIFSERRHAHLVGVDEVALRSALRADPTEIAQIGGRVRAVIGAATELEIRTGDARLILPLEPTHRWHVESGIIGPGESTGLPAGQLFTTPGSAEGTLIIDGSIYDPFAERRIGERGTVEAIFRGGMLEALRGSDEAEQFCAQLRTEGDAARLGQVCFGMNPAVITRSSNTAVNDVRPGVYLVLGYTASTWTGARWDGMRMTQISLQNATVCVDGEPILVDGSYRF